MRHLSPWFFFLTVRKRNPTQTCARNLFLLLLLLLKILRVRRRPIRRLLLTSSQRGSVGINNSYLYRKETKTTQTFLGFGI